MPSSAAARARRCAACVVILVATVSCHSSGSANPEPTPPGQAARAGECLAWTDPLPPRKVQAILRRAEMTRHPGPPGVRWPRRATPHPEDEAEVQTMRTSGLRWLDDAPDPACRDRRLVFFLGRHAIFGGLDAQLRDAAVHLRADDPAWSVSPDAVVAVADALPTADARAAFVRSILERHPNPDVRGAVLFDEMRRSWGDGDDERVAELFAILSSPPYADSPIAPYARAYDPNHPLAAGRRLPEFSVPHLDRDGRVGPADLDGEINLLVLWGTRCPPCVEGMPKLHEIAAAHPDLRVVSVASGDAPDEVRIFRERFPMPWTHGYVDDGDEARALVDAFGWHHVPLYVLVDREGTILAGPPRLDLDGVSAHLDR